MRFCPGLLACFFLLSAWLQASDVKGTVLDPSGAPVVGAQVSILNRLGLVAQTTTTSNGAFAFQNADTSDARLVVTAPGFRAATVTPSDNVALKLEIAAQSDSVGVVGSAVDVSVSEQGSSVDVISRQEIRTRNEPFAVDLLRYIPGVAFNQSGPTGGVSSLFLRGGNSNFTAVQIDGVPVNSFGGSFDFAHIPSEAVDRIDVIRGPQSAVYGSYANSGVIDFVTRQASAVPQLDVLAEGGSYFERRFSVTGSATVKGFGILASASRLDTDGPVVNSDYRNQNLLLNIGRRFGRQSFSAHGLFNSSVVGEPGPWGSDPKHVFFGIDTISRARNNFGEYGFHYAIDASDRVRQEVFGSFFLYNSGYQSAFGFGYNKDLRGQAEARTIVSVNSHYVLAMGSVGGREDVKNTYITDAAFEPFSIRRTDVAAYLENRFAFGNKLFINARGAGGVDPHSRRPRRRLLPSENFRRTPSRAPIPSSRSPTSRRTLPACIPRSARGCVRRAASNSPSPTIRSSKPERTPQRRRRHRAKLPAQLPEAGCHLLLQPLLRPHHHARRFAAYPQPLPVGEPRELARAGHGVLGSPPPGKVPSLSPAPIRCSAAAFSRSTVPITPRRCPFTWDSSSPAGRRTPATWLSPIRAAV